jgi:acyl-CoA dehydrogenase
MSGETSMIGDAVARMLEGAAAHAGGFDAGLWDTLVASGVPRLLRPESQGGAGDAFRDAAAVLQAVGQHGPDVPLADSLVGHALLARGGIDADDAPLHLDVVGPDGAPDPAPRPAGSMGHLLSVDPWGGTVRCVWRPASGQPRSFELAQPAAVQALLAVCGAAVLTGAMRRAIDLSLDWAGTRKQFGRPIGAFQAVQHSLATAAEELAASRAALEWAAAELQSGRPMPSAAVAKGRAAEAAGQVAAVAHQVHGAIGFTAEHALHRASRLLWLWRDRWGDETHWYAELGQAALAGGPDALFDLVIGEPPDSGRSVSGSGSS